MYEAKEQLIRDFAKNLNAETTSYEESAIVNIFLGNKESDLALAYDSVIIALFGRIVDIEEENSKLRSKIRSVETILDGHVVLSTTDHAALVLKYK